MLTFTCTACAYVILFMIKICRARARKCPKFKYMWGSVEVIYMRESRPAFVLCSTLTPWRSRTQNTLATFVDVLGREYAVTTCDTMAGKPITIGQTPELLVCICFGIANNQTCSSIRFANSFLSHGNVSTAAPVVISNCISTSWDV